MRPQSSCSRCAPACEAAAAAAAAAADALGCCLLPLVCLRCCGGLGSAVEQGTPPARVFHSTQLILSNKRSSRSERPCSSSSTRQLPFCELQGCRLHARSRLPAAQGALSPACDIYSLGCLMWELLHAQPLWVGLSQDAILARVAESQEGPPFARHIPAPVQV